MNTCTHEGIAHEVASPRLAPLKLRVEALEARDLPSGNPLDPLLPPPPPTTDPTQQTGTPPPTTPPTNTTPPIGGLTFTVDAHATTGTVVGIVTGIVGPDPSQPPSFAIVGGNADGAFAIDALTGTITVASSSPLDPAMHPTFALTVSATFGNVAAVCPVTITVEEPGQNAEEPDPQIAITQQLNEKYQPLRDAIAKLNSTLANGSVKKATDEVTALSDLLNAVIQVRDAAGPNPSPAAETTLNTAVDKYNARLGSFSRFITDVLEDATAAGDIADAVFALCQESAGDSFRVVSLGNTSSVAARYLNDLKSSITALNTRAANANIGGVDTSILTEPASDLGDKAIKFLAYSPVFPGDKTANGISKLNALAGEFRELFEDFIDPQSFDSSAWWASLASARLTTLIGTMRTSAGQAGFDTARGEYEVEQLEFSANVRLALGRVEAAAANLKDARTETNTVAAALGENGTPLGDLFRNDGLAAQISALKSAVLSLTAQTTAQLSLLATLGQQIGGQLSLMQNWSLTTFQMNHFGLLQECLQIYAVNLLLL